VRECAPDSDRLAVHVVRDWCWLGTAADCAERFALLEAPSQPQFDIDVTRLLLRRRAAGTLDLIAVPPPPSD
jgi:hypothetical protein